MKLSTIWVIGCISLVVAGVACLFVGVNPGFLHPPAAGEGGEMEEVIPPSSDEEEDNGEPEEKKEPGEEHRRVHGQSPDR